MISVEVDTIAIEALRRDCAEYFDGLPERLMTAGRYLKTKLGEYPRASRNPQPPRTDRQRRFLFAAIASGDITIPYPRTQSLANSYEVVPSGDSAVVVGTTLNYAPLVQGISQASYHSPTWTSARLVAVREEDTLVRMIAHPPNAFGGG